MKNKYSILIHSSRSLVFLILRDNSFCVRKSFLCQMQTIPIQ